jgi:predicted lysophospholipase L1 biosynthesis ABC-type transport system permease subunit
VHPSAAQPVVGDLGALERVRGCAPWRAAIWGLRLEAAGLAVIVVGLLISIGARDPGLWTVVGGMVLVGAGAVATIVGMVLVYGRLGSARPSDDLLRRALARDVAGLDRHEAGTASSAGLLRARPPEGSPATGDQEKRPNNR